MGRHANTREGRADDWVSCTGEDRADPDSWDDPAICEAWEHPPRVEPAEVTDVAG